MGIWDTYWLEYAENTEFFALNQRTGQKRKFKNVKCQNPNVKRDKRRQEIEGRSKKTGLRREEKERGSGAYFIHWLSQKAIRL